jgi:hypothetical protein
VNIIRKIGLAMAGALVLAAALLVPVAGASEAQPEITDPSGDAYSRKDSRDLTTAYFHTETNDTFKITMNLTSLETYTTPNEIPNAPTTEYEVYFSVANSNFAVACKVPVHGPFGMTIQFDIRSVSYGNNTTAESQIATLSGGNYDPTAHLITWLVQKNLLGGNLTAGTHLTKTWAAVYNKNFGDTSRRIEDRGPNAGYGRDYIIRGAPGAEIIKVELTAESRSEQCAPNDPAVFKISVYNNGTSQVSVDFFNSTPDKKGWTVVLGLETNVTLLANATRTLTVTVTPPRDAANKTSVTISISGKARAGNQTANTNIEYLTATVNYIPPKPPPTPFTTQLRNFFMKPTMLTYALYGIIGALIGLAVIGTVYSRMKRSREAEEIPPPPAPLPVK